MSGTLPLSSVLAALDRAGLTALVRARRIAAPTQVSDPIDLAVELLRPDSIATALAGLPRAELRLLAELGELVKRADDAGADQSGADQSGADRESSPTSLAHLAQLGLVADGAALPEVTAVLAARFEARGLNPQVLVTEGDAPASAPATEAEMSGWYAPALTTTAQIAWLLRDLERAPAKLNRGGGIASTWLRGFEERMHVTAADELVTLVKAANLVVADGSEPAPLAASWLATDHEARWIAVARASVPLAPRPLLAELGSDPEPNLRALIDDLPHRYPLIEESDLDAAQRVAALWERTGITSAGCFTRAGHDVVASSSSDDAQLASLGFPETAPGVYVQPDLSVIVPGPLSPADEAELSSLALPEQIGVASTLRITEPSLSDALDRGTNADEIREVFTRLSLTGVPQPLDYLISSLAERAGSIILSEHDGDEGRTRIDFVRPELRATVLVDRALTHLQFAEPAAPIDGAVIPPIFSKLRLDHALAALLDARYPARAATVVESAPTPPTAVPAAVDSAEDAPDPIEALIGRVIDAAIAGPGDLNRQVTLAIRDRSTIRVTVEIRGAVREFTVVPVSLSAGRMRALDEAAGVERTLPLDAITELITLS